MINLINGLDFSVVAFFGILFAFAATCMAIAKLNKFLPRDMGRAFAHDGSLSAGKPRGAGIIFVFTFVVRSDRLITGKICKETHETFLLKSTIIQNSLLFQ